MSGPRSHGATAETDIAEIAALEKKHPRRFLEMALSADGMRWRELKAPNRAEFRHSERPITPQHGDAK